jgi:cytochrome d ubiquinol oxidase subunit II
VAFEFRSKDENPRWRQTWDWAAFGGSLVASLLLGVAFANLARGVPIDAEMNYVGGFFNLLNPYALVGGLVTILIFVLYGAVFLSLKTQGELLNRARAAARRLWLPVVVLMLLFLVLTYLNTDILTKLGVNPGVIPLTGVGALLVAGYFIRREREGWAFAMLAVTIAFALVTLFMILYPRVMISSLNPEWSLTIDNAASSPYTLRLMTIVAGIFVPVVLVYQGWSYWVFRKRIENKVEKLVY